MDTQVKDIQISSHDILDVVVVILQSESLDHEYGSMFSLREIVKKFFRPQIVKGVNMLVFYPTFFKRE